MVDLLDHDVRFGQGFLFAPPRPLRPEGAANGGNGHQEPEKIAPVATAAIDPPLRAGNAALARRVAGPG